MGSPLPRAADAPPFLPSAPPAWAARALATLVVTLFLGALVATIGIEVPDTVVSPFVLVPVRGTEPVRAARGGIVTLVGVEDGQPVEAGAVLFGIDSTRVEDRSAEVYRSDPAAAVERLAHELAIRDAQHQETARREREDGSNAESRPAVLRAGLATSGKPGLAILAPCSGVVLRSGLHAPGAVVADGERLCELACANQQLEAELALPPSGTGRVASGDVVKLLYDAFPYRRHGVRYARLEWVSPVATSDSGKLAFRARAALADTAVQVDGESRPLLAGMGGSARVVVARRSVLSYVLAPIRPPREASAEAPKPPRDRSGGR